MITIKWNDPVFDRTQQDVDFARSKIKEWISSDSPEVYELKGCLNVSDLNRIEGNLEYISNTLNNFGYPTTIQCKDWNLSKIPTVSDAERIFDNIRNIHFAFFIPNDAPELPNAMLNFEEINSIEENLYLLYILIHVMRDSFKKSGTFVSGSRRILPLRRG